MGDTELDFESRDFQITVKKSRWGQVNRDLLDLPIKRGHEMSAKIKMPSSGDKPSPVGFFHSPVTEFAANFPGDGPSKNREFGPK